MIELQRNPTDILNASPIKVHPPQLLTTWGKNNNMEKDENRV